MKTRLFIPQKSQNTTRPILKADRKPACTGQYRLLLLVSKEEQLDHPNDQQHHAIDLRYCKRPLDPVNIVKKLIRKRRAVLFGRDPLMHNCDDDRCKDQVEGSIKESNHCLPPLRRQTVDFGLWHRDLHIVIMPAYAFPKTPFRILTTWSVDRTGFTGAGHSAALHPRVLIISGRFSGVHKLLWSHGCLHCPPTGVKLFNCQEREKRGWNRQTLRVWKRHARDLVALKMSNCHNEKQGED